MQPIVVRPEPTRWQTARVWIYTSVLALLVLAGILIAVGFVVFDIVTVPDDSNRGEHRSGTRVAVNTRSSPEHGALVAFTRPGDETIWIGRVLAVGNDLMAVSEGGLFLNGIPVDEPYLLDGQSGPAVAEFEVPADSVYVLADDRNHPAAAAMGLVPRQQIVGTVSFAVWPP